MSGTVAGGRKAAATNRELYGPKFYQQIGRIGGERGHTGGFASNPELARKAGAKGGRMSKRGRGSLIVKKIEPRRETIISLYEEGKSIPQIAKRFKVSSETLRRWARENIEGYGQYYGAK